MSVDELTEIVEPSGLFPNTRLISAYCDAALSQRFFVQELEAEPGFAKSALAMAAKLWAKGEKK